MNLFFFLLNCVNTFEILIVRFWGKRWKTLLRIRGGQLRVSEPAVPLALPLLGPLLNIGGVRLTGTAFHKCNYSESRDFLLECKSCLHETNTFGRKSRLILKSGRFGKVRKTKMNCYHALRIRRQIYRKAAVLHPEFLTIWFVILYAVQLLI